MVGVPSVTLLLHLLLIRFWGVHVAGPKIVAATHAMQPIKAMPSKHNSSDHTTVAMQEQFDALRQREQQMLARRVLDIVGTRKGDDGVPIVTDAVVASANGKSAHASWLDPSGWCSISACILALPFNRPLHRATEQCGYDHQGGSIWLMS
eukprot:m.157351 g.157351  ORF g.157351 m.157351 type:complete len:150 (-) comp11727_c0_seq18:1586-2035(-)